ASKFATYALGAVPVVVWVLINGMFLNSIMMWLLFVSLAMFSYLLYKLSQKNGFSPTYLIAGIVAYVVVAGILFITQGFDLPRLLTVLPLLIDDAAVPRFLAWLGIIFVPLAVYLGNQAHIPGDEVEINIPLIGGVAAVLFAVGAGALLGGFIDVNTEWALQPSDPRAWGGLLLTFMLTIYGIIIAFPIGLALALGRRSDLPLIKYLCTAYIELVRGSPFITVLFFMQLFIPLINSDFNQIPGSYRAIAATIAFSAAYLAENVRGGLQSLPPGQSEAAKALGLNPWQAVTLITMPQALRAVIPALVGQFISLFKDTSLVTIVGLIDLVGFVNAMVVQAEFIGTRLEGLLFISILYFVVSYMMSYVSRLLEASGSGSTRRM
ncbi:MAG: amino acid ABC transporter permease, partial [Phototrophicaceae bacterium]